MLLPLRSENGLRLINSSQGDIVLSLLIFHHEIVCHNSGFCAGCKQQLASGNGISLVPYKKDRFVFHHLAAPEGLPLGKSG